MKRPLLKAAVAAEAGCKEGKDAFYTKRGTASFRRFGGPNKKRCGISMTAKLCRSNGVGMEHSGMT